MGGVEEAFTEGVRFKLSLEGKAEWALIERKNKIILSRRKNIRTNINGRQ